MTTAVCVYCGAMKFGALVRCRSCGSVPARQDEEAWIYSFVFTDHYFDRETLEQISSEMKAGAPMPKLPPEQEEKFRKAFAGSSKTPPKT